MWVYLILCASLATFALGYRHRSFVTDTSKKVLTNVFHDLFIEIHHDYYIVHYPYGITWYKIRVPRVRCPSVILSITDEHNNDVSSHVNSFMGPGQNFHNVPLTPNLLGYKRLTFECLEETCVFEENDTILLPQEY